MCHLPFWFGRFTWWMNHIEYQEVKPSYLGLLPSKWHRWIVKIVCLIAPGPVWHGMVPYHTIPYHTLPLVYSVEWQLGTQTESDPDRSCCVEKESQVIMAASSLGNLHNLYTSDTCSLINEGSIKTVLQDSHRRCDKKVSNAIALPSSWVLKPYYQCLLYIESYTHGPPERFL